MHSKSMLQVQITHDTRTTYLIRRLFSKKSRFSRKSVHKIDMKIVHRIFRDFPNIHDLDIVLNCVQFVKVDARHGEEPLICVSGVDSDRVLDHLFFRTGV